MANVPDSRHDLIMSLYNAVHEGEATLPDPQRLNHMYDGGTGTLYCYVNEKSYETEELSFAVRYFKGIADSIDENIASSKNPEEQQRKAKYCRFAAEAIEYMIKNSDKK